MQVGLRGLIDELGLSDRVILTGYLDDAALGRWYRHAALFAFPSLFEGFGMPPVEALGFGLPVLTTDRTALPEVTLGLARLVSEPENPAAWASHLAEMLRTGARPSTRRPRECGGPTASELSAPSAMSRVSKSRETRRWGREAPDPNR